MATDTGSGSGSGSGSDDAWWSENQTPSWYYSDIPIIRNRDSRKIKALKIGGKVVEQAISLSINLPINLSCKAIKGIWSFVSSVEPRSNAHTCEFPPYGNPYAGEQIANPKCIYRGCHRRRYDL